MMPDRFPINCTKLLSLALLLALLSPALLSSCSNCNLFEKELSTLVEIEYDHRLNFDQYKFKKSPTQQPFPGCTVETSTIIAKGVWLVYHICSIKNQKSQAKDFKFDLSKFYVEHNGKNYHPKQFSSDDLIDPTLSGTNLQCFYNLFREEVFTASNQEVIAKNTSAYLSISWRFAILVPYPADPKNLSPALRYDNSGGESLLITNRGWSPDYVSKATESNFSAACRPKG